MWSWSGDAFQVKSDHQPPQKQIGSVYSRAAQHLALKRITSWIFQHDIQSIFPSGRLPADKMDELEGKKHTVGTERRQRRAFHWHNQVCRKLEAGALQVSRSTSSRVHMQPWTVREPSSLFAQSLSCVILVAVITGDATDTACNIIRSAIARQQRPHPNGLIVISGDFNNVISSATTPTSQHCRYNFCLRINKTFFSSSYFI